MSASVLPTETPLPRPPPGPTYVTVVPIELSFRLFVASLIIAFLVLITLVLRVISRSYIALKLGWDDALVFVASIFSFGQTVLFALLVFGGLGHHAYTVPPPNQFSIPKQPLYVAVCVWSIFTDLLVLVVPLPIIWRLKMERSQKIRLSWLFAAGLSVTATSIIRLAYIVTINYHDDFSFHSVPSTFLAFLEPQETILCVSLPMIYSFIAKLWPGNKSRNASTPHAGPPHSHTYGSSFARRVDPQKRNFTPLGSNLPDPFELNEMHGAQREVQVSCERKGRANRTLGTRTKSIDRDAESSSGSETGLVEPISNSNKQNGGIMVSKNFTVSVTQRE
ncbi:hypothetical protein GQX73_g3035 [Xylaria multiplex]|uniref:Rhodopsin domain-containing protein n=1 Tax=Xylaria multiplex TaxID=323545 RepID=A0A7C8MX26_9PEZI|nr:hypothetical protein GQX73_g3035 [Xylaria multiplex]